MANFFTNENTEKVLNATGQYGFVAEGLSPTMIDDHLVESGDVLGKLGSSMPTPFARLFLYSVAFAQVNSEESLAQGQGHYGIKDSITGIRVPSVYHHLVGECLDMLELIFKYGDNEMFHVTPWNFSNACDALDVSKTPGHRELGVALRAAHQSTVLKEVNDIYLFSWGYSEIDRVYLGGTSPISLVYASANLRRDLLSKGLTFVGDAGNQLFSENPTPLHKRSDKFREFMYRYQLNDINTRIITFEGLSNLDKYISDSGDHYDSMLKGKVAHNNNYVGVKNLQSQGNTITSAGISLYMSDNTVDLSNSDYVIKPTVEGPYKEWVNEIEKIYPTPLALIQQGIDGAIYGAGRKWNSGTDKIPATLPDEISIRKLPGFGQVYPYLTIDDFLESKIIEVSYNLDSNRFFTGCKGKISHLLPLKKEFFKFFKISDLVKDNGEFTDMMTITEDDNEEVTVKLRIPLANGRSLVYYRRYDKEHKIDCYDMENTFDFAIFPFYRVISADNNVADNNVYNIMFGKTLEKVDLHFYKVENLNNKPGNVELNNVSIDVRNAGKAGKISTSHINVPSAFDFFDLSVNGVNALIIPLFGLVDLNQSTKIISFCIDFGTTNTHVAYAIKPVNDSLITIDDIHSLDITSKDQQVVNFHNEQGVAEFNDFPTAFKREFVPVFILADTENIQGIQFPMRTTTCQVNTPTANLKMFANTNIGFNYNEELISDNDLTASCAYYTNIKWDLNDTKSEERVREYFKEMLWIMKNKAFLNGANDDFKVVVTYPQSMREKEAQNLKDVWIQAKEELKCNKIKIEFKYESITPYYAYLSDLGFGDPYANIDIGGGTTDILYVNPITKESISLSAFFAANDLWNDGADERPTPKSNGFLAYYENSKEYRDMSVKDKTNYENAKRISTRSSDVISYLFSHDDETKISRAISRSPEMMELLVVHFSSLIYYLAYAVDLSELACPVNITFTGMGSKYIKLISSNESKIAELVMAIFAFYGKQMANEAFQKKVNVKFAPQPKVITAKGGLIVSGHTRPITPESLVIYGFEGEDGSKTLRYENIKECIGEVNKFYKGFVELFNDEAFFDVLSDLDNPLSDDLGATLLLHSTNSVNVMLDSLDSKSPRCKVNEPLFFWPLKDALYQVGKKKAQKLFTNSRNN